MIIFLTQRSIYDKHGSRCDMLETDYVNFFRTFFSPVSKNIVAIPVNNHPKNTKALLENILPDLIILTGGGNVIDVSCCNGQDISISRELTERILYTFASKKKIPVLAICRGMQFVNLQHGGALSKIEGHIGPHQVISNQTTYTVNSFHHFGIKTDNLAEGIDVAAICKESNVIEAYGSVSKRILGIQWHPEREGSDPMLLKNLCHKYLGVPL